MQQLQTVAGRDVLMLQRFDRKRADNGYFRLGFVSALSVLDAEDSYLSRDRWSYPLLAAGVRRWSSRPQRDCAELFRRMVFNAAVTNNDDHPRNHALLRHSDGWRLSPVYDVVPVPVVSLERRDLTLIVGDSWTRRKSLLPHFTMWAFRTRGSRSSQGNPADRLRHPHLARQFCIGWCCLKGH